MRQAITTKYYGPTNNRQTRIKAMTQLGFIFIDWDHSLGLKDNHKRAAVALANKFNWLDYGELIGGWDQDGQGVFVLVAK